MGPCKVIIVSYSAAQKDGAVAHLPLPFLVCLAVCCQTLALLTLHSHFLLSVPFLCFSSAFPWLILLKLLFSRCFFFADMIREAREWRPAKTVSMNIDSRMKQGEY